MKLLYPKAQIKMDLYNDRLNSLVMEHTEIFEKIASAAMYATERKGEDMMLYHDENQYDISRYAEIIFTPFDLTYDKREIQKKLFSSLQDIAETHDIMGFFAEANGCILELLDKLDFESEYNIVYEEDFNFTGFLKNYSVHICEPEGSFTERAIEYMINLKKLLDKNVFIFVNCDAYISENDYFHLEKCAQHYGIYILFLRNQQIPFQENINECIIDKDLCEIH